MVISGSSVIKDYEQPAINKMENLDEVFSLLVDMYKNTVKVCRTLQRVYLFEKIK